MVLKVPYLFFKSLNILKSDKTVILFGLIPVLIGFTAYYFLGSYVFGDLQIMAKDYLSSKMDMTGIFGDILFGIFMLVFAVLMNFTFFIFVSIIAAPFNDLISSRVEKIYGLSREDDVGFSEMIKRLPKTLKNEAKKVGFIVLLSIVNIIISMMFPPVSFVLAGIILAISFIDYSWSRNDLTFSECVKDLKNGFLPYMLGGVSFMFLISIPIINLFFLPLAVVFFTVIFCEMKGRHA